MAHERLFSQRSRKRNSYYCAVALNFNNLAIAPSNPKNIYLATNRGVYRCTDRGDTWQAVNDGLLDTAVKRIMESTSFVLTGGDSGIYKISE